MPWQPEPFNSVIKEAKVLIFDHFKINTSANIFICSFSELEKAILKELKDTNITEEKIEHIKKIHIKRVIGKYFSKTNDIWLLEGKGNNIEVLMHELLHSIQKCSPNREKIVDYLTYKITGLRTQIPNEIFKEWREIEKNYGYKKIKTPFLLQKDCEDF